VFKCEHKSRHNKGNSNEIIKKMYNKYNCDSLYMRVRRKGGGVKVIAALPIIIIATVLGR